MSLTENVPSYTGQQILAIVSRSSPTPYPVHRSLEAEALEMQDIAERDYAARMVFARRAAQ
jgi:hypothetical protein